MKTKGAKNKPKYKLIRLSDLNKMFLPSALVPVDVRYLFDNLQQTIPQQEVMAKILEEDKIELIIHDEDRTAS